MVVTLTDNKKKAEGYREDFIISSSKADKFRMCPMAYYFPYIADIWPVQETDPLRIGTNWHRLHELSAIKPGAVCPECAPERENNPQCVICRGMGFAEAGNNGSITQDIIIRELTRAYDPARCPSWKTDVEWVIEKVTLFYSFLAYRWYYSNNSYPVVATETPFKYQLPDTNIIINGRMDKILQAKGYYLIGEIKSMSSSVEADSALWPKLRMALQPSFYVTGARGLQKSGEIPDDLPILGVLYDVWHKPTTKPKGLTQADTLAFLQTGMYFNQKFEIKADCAGARYLVDGVQIEVKPGKKEGTLAIKESPEMYGVRLFADIIERPHFYFAKREIARTDPDLDGFVTNITNICKTIELMKKHNCWYRDEKHCEATFKCPYISICYNNVVIDPEHLPEGYEHRFNKKEKK